MMTLAQRVRDFRYAKGWGPDELANRAEISRTALYQIESGKTGLPRAGTLRRIAVALDVSMDDLLSEDEAPASPPAPGAVKPQATFRTRGLDRWFPAEGGPLSLPATTHAGLGGGHAEDFREKGRPIPDAVHRGTLATQESALLREGELLSKLHDLLHSPIGSAVARVLDELHGLLPRSRNTV
ncbi:helix-turn-helix domain-containing protein [Paludisphaera mucosa]|uniref:Helix-turn-helix transcriptional regulator n=1 Tax=Paludisphaera mucosa TaxID=3030827 RepID=A0ABT6F8Q0_9BACT|nr:helix-turn-helix transcriptional regulator [Paludisphaera mucosa]MDG3003961.1 helix-turn-helix transcriptional regulator [Paludisphaera mucosa]